MSSDGLTGGVTSGGPTGGGAADRVTGGGWAAGGVTGSGAAGGVTGGGAGDGGVTGGGVPVPAPWSRIRDSQYCLQETLRRGQPELRPEHGRIVLARTEGMAKREAEYHGRALFVNLDHGVRVTPEELVAALEQHCGVRRTKKHHGQQQRLEP
jgi:hypothetical protein